MRATAHFVFVFMSALLAITSAVALRSKVQEASTCTSCLKQIAGLKRTILQLASQRNALPVKAADTPVANLYGPNIGTEYMKSGEAITNWITSSSNAFAPILEGGMTYENGSITVPTDGVYYVYAQVYYAPQQDDTGNCGMAIYVNNNQWIQVSGQRFTNGARGLNTQYAGHLRKLTAEDKLVVKASDDCTFYFGSIYNFFGAYLVN